MGTRIVFGALLGVGGAAAVAIKQLFLVVLSFITFHATQEYYAMVSSKGITRGMAAPPRIVSALTTVLCVSMVMFSYFYRGRSGTVLAVAAFFLLVMNMVAIRKPKFSQLASTLFGVFYCGALVVEACGGAGARGMAGCPYTQRLVGHGAWSACAQDVAAKVQGWNVVASPCVVHGKPLSMWLRIPLRQRNSSQLQRRKQEQGSCTVTASNSRLCLGFLAEQH